MTERLRVTLRSPRVLVIVAVLLIAPDARAQPAPPAPDVEARFLRVDSSAWSELKLTKGGVEVGPGFLYTRMSDAVRGSPTAERHARHARIWRGFAFGFQVTTLATALGGAIDLGIENGSAGSHSSFPTVASVLFIAAGVSYLGAMIVQQSLQSEILRCVNAYNYDLVSGQLH